RDDMLIACKSKAESGSTKSLLKKESNMKDLGEAKKILDMEIVRDRSRRILRVSQSGDCDVERMSKVSYANTVGSLMYLMVCTRPDIAYAVSIVSRYLANPGKSHWEAVKWILKYLRGTANVGLIYGTNHCNHMDVTGFVDSDYAKDPNKDRSITGYAFLVQGCVVSWKAMLQHVLALSTTEVEYMALTEAVKEAGSYLAKGTIGRVRLIRLWLINYYMAALLSVRSIANTDPSHRNLFIRGIGWDTTTATLKSVFEKYGEVEEGLVIVDMATNKSKGYDFVTFKHVDGAVKALVEPSKK
nr:retrovirus-related Pol polyprotein from transposon TNT 1-94 [Tanacetum cinerariifolium]